MHQKKKEKRKKNKIPAGTKEIFAFTFVSGIWLNKVH